MVEQYAEYAVEVLGIGFVGGTQHPPFHATVGAEAPDVFLDEDTAFTCAKKIADDYRRLGQPDMAAKVGLHARIVTVTREDWATLALASA